MDLDFLFTNNSTRDLQRRFLNSVIQINRIPVLVRGIERSPENNVLTVSGRALIKGKWETVGFTRDGIKSISDAIPHLGTVTTFNGGLMSLVYVQVTNDRQWSRGYNAQRLHITSILREESQRFGIRYIGILNSTEVVDQVFNGLMVFSFTDALSKLREGEALNVHIGNDFWLGNSIRYNKPVIGYRNFPIGYVEGDRVFVFSYANFLIPSVEKLVTNEVGIKEVPINVS